MYTGRHHRMMHLCLIAGGRSLLAANADDAAENNQGNGKQSVQRQMLIPP